MNKKIVEFKDGESYICPLLVNQVTKGVTGNGSTYLSLTLQDDSGQIESKMWDAKEDVVKLVESGQVYDFKFDVLKYRNSLQLRVNEIKKSSEEYNIREFVSSAPASVEEMQKIIRDALNSLNNPIYRSIMVALFTEYKLEFFDYPAASKNHHSFIGGLATHVIGMLKVANSLCELYPFLNRDLLISGILVHDLGKITELSGAVATEYTLEGKLLGHISIIHAKVFDLAKELELEHKEEVTLLRHMILAHHGKLEYGSPVLPQVMEAEVLYFIDNLDARLDTLTTALNATEEGQFTSRLFPMENRAFYKPKKND